MPKYRIGDIVTYAPASRVRQKFPAGAYKIVSLMPHEDSQDETAYRIKSVAENVERVAKENELAPHE
jgi:hypothetical protein